MKTNRWPITFDFAPLITGWQTVVGNRRTIFKRLKVWRHTLSLFGRKGMMSWLAVWTDTAYQLDYTHTDCRPAIGFSGDDEPSERNNLNLFAVWPSQSIYTWKKIYATDARWLSKANNRPKTVTPSWRLAPSEQEDFSHIKNFPFFIHFSLSYLFISFFFCCNHSYLWSLFYIPMG